MNLKNLILVVPAQSKFDFVGFHILKKSIPGLRSPQPKTLEIPTLLRTGFVNVAALSWGTVGAPTVLWLLDFLHLQDSAA
jgi:hypothetical protein